MMPDDKYQDIARGLLEKTRMGAANWEGDFAPRTYSLQLPASRVLLSYVSPSTEYDRVVLRLCHTDGTVAAMWTVEDETERWELAQELFVTVERQVLGWDKVLADVEAFLHGAANVPASVR